MRCRWKLLASSAAFSQHCGTVTRGCTLDYLQNTDGWGHCNVAAAAGEKEKALRQGVAGGSACQSGHKQEKMKRKGSGRGCFDRALTQAEIGGEKSWRKRAQQEGTLAGQDNHPTRHASIYFILSVNPLPWLPSAYMALHVLTPPRPT